MGSLVIFWYQISDDGDVGVETLEFHLDGSEPEPWRVVVAVEAIQVLYLGRGLLRKVASDVELRAK